MKEPFKFGCIVEDEHFCPRPELQSQLTRYINAGQNLVLQGERRRGKSSLVVKSVHEISGMGLLYVDLLGIETAADFCCRVLDGVVELDKSRSFLRKTAAMLAQLRPLLTIDAISGAPSLSIDVSSADKSNGFGAVMSMVAAHARERRICVVMDEIQDILNLPDANKVLSELRGKIQFLSETSFVFLGSVRNEMSGIFSHPKSPFFKSALEIDIADIDRQKFTEFLASRFRNADRIIEEAFVGEVIDAVDAVPGDVQELCDALWSVTDSGKPVTRDDLKPAYAYIFAHEGASYEIYLRQLTANQRKILKTLASLGGAHVSSNEFRCRSGICNASSIKKAMSRLMELGHVYYYRNEYRFASPFFREWIKNRL